MQITVRLCRSSSRCFRYVIIHTVIPCNLQKSRIGTTPRYYSICEISRDRSIRRVNNTNLKGRRNDAYVGSVFAPPGRERAALGAVYRKHRLRWWLRLSLFLSLFLHMSMHKYARARAVHPLRADRILWLRIGWNNSVEEIYDAFFNILEKRGRINVMIGLLRWITAN